MITLIPSHPLPKNYVVQYLLATNFTKCLGKMKRLKNLKTYGKIITYITRGLGILKLFDLSPNHNVSSNQD